MTPQTNSLRGVAPNPHCRAQKSHSQNFTSALFSVYDRLGRPSLSWTRQRTRRCSRSLPVDSDATLTEGLVSNLVVLEAVSPKLCDPMLALRLNTHQFDRHFDLPATFLRR